MDVLVYLEHDGDTLQGEMARLMDKAATIAAAVGGHALGAIVMDTRRDMRQELRLLNGHEIVMIRDPSLEEYEPEAYQAALRSIVENVRPTVVLFRHSYAAMELAPGVACALNAPVLSNCLDVEIRNGQLSVIRPHLRELCWTRTSPCGAPPYFLTLQRFSLEETPSSTVEPEIREIAFSPPAQPRIRSLGISRRTTNTDIAEAEKIVAVGRGIQDPANIELVEELAAALDATVACSRPIADLGWLPVERQVGLSGQTVRPKVYLACGISGESQHVAGMKDSALIIAINSDAAAPIFRVAHYGVVADLLTFLPVLTRAAKHEP